MDTQTQSQTETLEVTANVRHLLKILSSRVNSSPNAALREYLANAHDASVGQQDPKLRIWAEPGIIHIEDQGRGMSRADIVEAFTCIGSHRAAEDVDTIGEFGLGKLSAFMIADQIVVETFCPTDPTGWRLAWQREASHYQLTPSPRRIPGTSAALHLSADFSAMASDPALRNFVECDFGLLGMPIMVGSDRRPANVYYQWVCELARYSQPRLLPLTEAREVFKKFCGISVCAAYVGYYNGARIMLGIPQDTHPQLDDHKVTFFSKGVLVKRGISRFFPEYLSFMVAIIDHPNFALQIDREGLVRDRVFESVSYDIKRVVMDFLMLLGDSEPQVATHVLRTHRATLLAQFHHEPQLIELFRRHYLFETTAGMKRWRELVGFASGLPTQRALYYLSDQNFQYHQLTLARASGTLVVLASAAETELLKDLGAADGIQVFDAERLTQDQLNEACPIEFRILASLLAAPMMRHGIGDISLMMLPSDPKPSLFRIETTDTEFMRSGSNVSSQLPGTMVGIKGLILNIGHSLIQSLAARGQALSGETLQRAADVLYGVAALHSPFPEARLRVTHQLTESLIAWIQCLLAMEPEPTPIMAEAFAVA